MLSIGVVGPAPTDGGQAKRLKPRATVRYYIERVANSMDDYYVGSGEAPGYWIGAGATSLGLAGRVEPGVYLAVMDGRHPHSGETLVAQRRADRVCGYDLTFSAPKGLSLLWAFGDKATREAVTRIHDDSIAEALAVMESEACRLRRGHNGERVLDGGGFVGAAFRHRQSREGDPQLHTHVVVANLAADPSGRYSALDGSHLFDFAAAVGACYQSALRQRTADLGLAWDVRPNGLGEVAGLPRPVLRHFSKRRRGIEADMADRGVSSAKEAQRSTLGTRRSKAKELARLPDDDLSRRWRGELNGLTIGLRSATPDDVIGVIGAPRKAEGLHPQLVQSLVDPGWQDSVSPEAEPPGRRRPLWRRASTLTYAQVLRGLATAADDDPLHIRDQARRLFSREEVVPVTTGGPTRAGRRRFTTRWVLEEEAALLARVKARAPVQRCPEAIIGSVVGEASLGRDQERAARAVLSSARAVDVVVGQAGTGKTHLLSVLRRAWEADGRSVIGTALAAVAAKRLEEGSGIASETCARVLRDIEAPGGLVSGAVLVVDEAGVVGTHMLGRLLAVAERSGARVVLIGDHLQLPEVDTGGAFRALAREPTATLTLNRRQEHRWERRALAELRHGRVGDAVEAYRSTGRLHVAAHLDDAMDAVVAGWNAGPDALMVAATRSEVEGLNRRARELLVDLGRLGPDEVVFGDRGYRIGERVVALRVDRRVGLRNGERGVVVGLAPEGLSVVMEDGRTQPVPAVYAQSHLDWGYALTAHKSQGITVEATHVLGTEALYRELGYTGMSRGRRENHLYTVLGEEDGAERLVERLSRSMGQHLASESLPGAARASERLVGLLQEVEALNRADWLSPPEEKRLVGLQRDAARELGLLGEQVALCRPRWATAALGAVPLGSATATARWTSMAGAIAAYRSMAGVPDTDARALGPPFDGALGQQRRVLEEGLRHARVELGLGVAPAERRRATLERSRLS